MCYSAVRADPGAPSRVGLHVQPARIRARETRAVTAEDALSVAQAKPRLSTAKQGFSVVVPLQDEEESVVALLESLAAQTLPPDEVVLVDAGSRDRTVERAQQAAGALPISVVKADRIFPGLARNEGVARSSRPWIAFTDGGIRLDQRWLEALAGKAGTDVDAVFGNYDPDCPSVLTQCAAMAYVPPRNKNGIRGESIASCAVRRSVLDALGGFPGYRASEDLIVIESIHRRFRVAYAPSARVHWQIARSWRGTFVRFAQYSCQNLAAGRGRYWHLGVARLYALLALSILVAGMLGFGPWKAVLVPAFFVARALKSAWLKRGSFDFETLNPVRVLGAAAILVVLDLATLVGAIRWLFGHTVSPPRV